MMIVRIRVLYLNAIIKWEMWPICHCLGLGNETVVCAVCLSMLLFKQQDDNNCIQCCHGAESPSMVDPQVNILY